MAECKFCYLDKNGDIPDDRKDLIYKKNIKLSDTKITCYGAKGTLKIKKSFNLYAGLGTDRKGNGTLWVGCFDGETDDAICDEIKLINYCPMCGRKLEEWNSNQ